MTELEEVAVCSHSTVWAVGGSNPWQIVCTPALQSPGRCTLLVARCCLLFVQLKPEGRELNFSKARLGVAALG